MIARGTSSEKIYKQWEKFVVDLDLSMPPGDINSLVQLVLNEAYMENLSDLEYHAEKVKLFNERKKRIENTLAY
jgi:hypothetical protein